MKQQNDATIAQIQAARPTVSIWVSANAGSGKTRVLTDRVARLLLRGTEPQRILCLTYTKAAASHMQNQLFKRLGKWAMLNDTDLTEALASLGEAADPPTTDQLRNARTLFARALETPGGLKIQTIHSFCASLLRRFPLESGVSPQFQEMDDRSGKRLRAEILEDLAQGHTQPAFDAMAFHLSGENTDGLVQEIARNREQFDPVHNRDDIWHKFGLPAGFTHSDLLAEALPGWIADVLPDLQSALLTGLATDIKNAGKLAQLDISSRSLTTLKALESMFVFGSSKKLKNPNAAKTGSFPTKALRESMPDLMEAVEQLMQLIEDGRRNRLRLAAAEKTAALHLFAQAFLPEYSRRKQLRGWLDFDDLILKARDLLTDGATAQWVLFRLDGGIDHILVDEAQDTSPTQWDVITRLTEEFTTGIGARANVQRTIFVVGDEKQSIYSFQGADPAAFSRMRDHFTTHLQQIKQNLERQALLFSFRSAEPILQVVDAVLQADERQDLADSTLHRAFHTDLPGRVDLWPFLEKTESEQENEWFDPVDMPAPDDPARQLAGQIADHIRQLLDANQPLHRNDGPKMITAGDFLILVQRRSSLFHETIKALKEREIPVAGADRLKIGGELAVRDLLAILAFMALPEDDLSLACALRSPLLGQSEAQLYNLAQGRKASLWQSLRQMADQHSDIWDILNNLLNQVDFLRPFELLEHILTHHNGRINLIARLGPEAEDGIDALLAEALRYEQIEAPTLTGFLGWMETGEVEIKRQMDTNSDQVRVMTVHGAKGLESPIVILPDTGKRTMWDRSLLAKLETGITAWKTSADDSPQEVTAAQQTQNDLQGAENQRLLYVALSRAENWLIICGAGDRGKGAESWYDQVDRALDTMGALPALFSSGPGKRLQSENWPVDQVDQSEAAPASPVSLPDWAVTPAPKIEPVSKPLSPSDLGGAKVLPAEGAGRDEEAAKRHGRQIHRLLEILPDHPSDRWSDIASQVLSAATDQASAQEASALLAEVAPILQDPDLAFLFADDALAEVAITAHPDGFGDRPLFGVIDVLICDDDRVLVVDFKSNSVVPDSAAAVPEGLLRQMAAYCAALAEIYPGKTIDAAILWTKTGLLMDLPHDSVRQSFKLAPTP